MLDPVKPPPPDIDPLLGTVLGGCRIERLLGRGGMGAVYLATQIDLERRVALKVLPSDLAANQAFLQRFEREARTIAQVSHSNIVQVFFTGREGQRRFLVMEYVEGLSLAGVLRARGRLPVEEAVDAILQSARALAAAWARGIVHRDIKPENILVTPDGQVKVADFGLAKNTEEATSHTQTGSLLGTAHYMSPEQAKGQQADIRADVYALGITFWECLAGKRPFEGHTPVAILYKHMYETLADVRTLAPETPEEIATLIAAMAHKSPDDRIATPAAVVVALDAYLNRTGRRGRLTLPAAATATVEIGTPAPTPRQRMEAETPTQRRPSPSTDAEALQIAQAESEWASLRPQAMALDEAGKGPEGAALIDGFLARPHKGSLRRVEAAALAQALRTDDIAGTEAHLASLSFEDATSDSLWQMGLRAWRDGEFAEALDTWCELAQSTRRDEVIQCAKAAFVNLARAIEARAHATREKRALFRELAAVTERASKSLGGWPRLTAIREWAVYADVPDDGRAAFEEAEALAQKGDPRAMDRYRDAHSQFLANPAWESRARGAIAAIVRRIVDSSVREVASLTGSKGWDSQAAAVWKAWIAVRRGLAHEPNNAVLVRTKKKVETSTGFTLVKEWQEALDSVEKLKDNREKIRRLLALKSTHAGTPFEADLAAEADAVDARIAAELDAVADAGRWIELLASWKTVHPQSPRWERAAEREREMMYRRALQRARKSLDDRDGQGARVAAEEALGFRPGEAEAVALRDEAEKMWSRYDEAISKAERHTKTRAWKAAIDAAAEALSCRPGDSRATSVMLQARESFSRDITAFDGLRTLAGHTHPVTGVAFAPDGKTLVSASADASLRLWDAATGAPTAVIPAHPSGVTALVVSPRNVAATAGATIRLWDVTTRQQIRELALPRALAVAFSPDGALLATASEDKSIRLWNVSTGKESATLPWPLMGATALALSPDGRFLATAGINASICTLSSRTAASLPKQVGAFAKCVAFAPDGRLLVAGRTGIWLCAPGSWEGVNRLDESGDRVRGAAFSPDGSLVAIADGDSIAIWETKECRRVHVLRGHSAPLSAVAFSSDGRLVASGSADKSVRVWGAKL
jgi:predicted Ser/Thr protein kinase/sugar lactone lactonase YvrE